MEKTAFKRLMHVYWQHCFTLKAPAS